MSHTPDPHDGAQPELLEQGGGRPLDRDRPGRRRKVLVPVLAGLGLAAVGGAAFGAWWFLDEGAQAAEALPASAVGYVGLTLDPSGSQKLEALRTLEKFPLIAEELGLDGDLGEIDLREELADVLIAESGCDGLSYDDDIEPWLGERIGLAAVALTTDTPSPLIALEVRDEDAATEGIAAVTECVGEQDSTAYSVEDGWMLVAETEEDLRRAGELVEDEGTLADDEDFQRWSGELDAGLLTMYAAPGVGTLLLDNWDAVMGFDPSLGAPAEPPAEVVEAAEQFEGGIAQVRFDDGGLELELAGSMGESELLDAFDGDAGTLVEDLTCPRTPRWSTPTAWGRAGPAGWPTSSSPTPPPASSPATSSSRSRRPSGSGSTRSKRLRETRSPWPSAATSTRTTSSRATWAPSRSRW